MSKSPIRAIDDDDEGETERLTSKEFLDLIPHLSFPQILQVEIFNNKTWKKLVCECLKQVPGQKYYYCAVCKISQSMKNMLLHLAGKRHVAAMQDIVEIFHPEYTYPKSRKQTKTANEIVPEIESEATPSLKNLVVNPLTLNRSKLPAAEANKTKEPSPPAKNAEKTVQFDDSEIPEVIIIDDYDEEPTAKNSPKKSVEKEPQPPSKKPKITVSAFAKCLESSEEKDKDKETTKSQAADVLGRPQSTKASVNDEKYQIHGFVGVEYVVKVCGDLMPTRYECGLCELCLGFDDMQKHLLGYSHRLKFCEKHFPTAIQQFRQYIVDLPADEHYKVMIPVLQKLAEAIERHHGRAKPFECNTKRFNQERIRVLTEVFARAHASEQDGPTFTHVINSKDVDQFISKRNTFNHQEKIVETAIFDHIKPGASRGKIPVVKHRTNIDNKPIVKMANAMRMHFQMSQPYHVDGLVGAHPYVEPQPYMGQQPYMNHPPQFMEQTPFGAPPQQHFMGPQPQPTFNRQQTVDDETHKRMVDKFLRANNKDSHNSSSRSHHRDRDRHDRPDRNAHQTNRNSERSSSHRSRSPPRSSGGRPTNSTTQHMPDIWRSYCRLVEHKLNALDERFKTYKANPESHPLYNEEWQKFWQRRKSELIAMGKDYRTHDYQPDWVLFFNNRINELYEDAFDELKVQSREELSLPLTNDCVMQTKYYVRPRPIPTMENESSIEQPAMADFVTPNEIHQSANNTAITYDEPSTAAQVIIAEDTFGKQSSRSGGVSIQIEDDKTPTFVSVLRLLTALEDHLGSLGPKIVELLTKALQAEKSSPAHGLALINDDNCTLLETAMEKFKGLVIAGILDSAKERALKKAIAKVTVFLEVAKKTRELVAQRPTPTAQSTTNDEMPRKQQAIEKKIAALLAAQGQTNFDREKLEQLAAVCLLLDKKKRESATTAAANSLASSSRSQPPVAQKPLSDALSDIMGNFGSASATARKPADSGGNIGRSTNNQYHQQHTLTSSSSSSSSNYANGNSVNIDRNFGSTYGNNVSNFPPQNNRNMEPMNAWQNDKQQQQYRGPPNQPHNMIANNWHQDANQSWGASNQPVVSYPIQPNRPPMRRGPYM